MSEKGDYVEITIKVPKSLMQAIEGENYFGWSKEKFFTTYVRRGVDCELNELDFDKAVEIEKKYGIKTAVVVDLSEKEKS